VRDLRDLYVGDVSAFDTIFTEALGAELRRQRDRNNFTQAELAGAVGGIHAQTLATYEQGTRRPTVARFVEICSRLQVDPSQVLADALLHADVELSKVTIEVDLAAVVKDNRSGYTAVRSWATRRLSRHPGESAIQQFSTGALQEIAVVLGYADDELLRYLAAFSPYRLGQREHASQQPAVT
jgi:transcriptional regulator with XRE-family HTH domain